MVVAFFNDGDMVLTPRIKKTVGFPQVRTKIRLKNYLTFELFPLSEAMLTKDKVLEVITDLPSTFSIDDLVDRLIILEN